MDQEPQESTANEDGGKSGFFQNINKVIAGVTGLLIALAGLAASWDKIFGEKDQKQELVGNRDSAGAGASEPSKPQPPAARPTHYKGHLYDAATERFNAGTAELRREVDRWVLTDSRYDEPFIYDERVTDDKDNIMLIARKVTSALRFPVGGGVVEESTTLNRDEWKTYADIKPADS